MGFIVKAHSLFPVDNFRKVLSATSINKVAPFDFESSFVEHYFGHEKTTQLDYFEFAQLLQVGVKGQGGGERSERE
jgi:hypothetical protein